MAQRTGPDFSKRLMALALSALLLTSLPAPAAETASAPSTAQHAELGENKESGGKKQTFTIDEYRILGNSVLPPRDIEALLYPLLGNGKAIDDVETARRSLEALYRERGFGTLYVDIPEQQVDAGVVRLRVTEGRLARVRITGAHYYSNRRIQQAVPELQAGNVVHLPTLQNELSRLNQQARDRQVTPVLRAGNAPGAVDIELKVKDTLPLHASAEVNDRYTANTTQTRLNLNASYDNLFQRYQSLSFQYQTSPEKTDEVRLLAATYIVPSLDSGNVFALYGVDTNSDFAAAGTSSALGILGTGRIYGARYIVRLPAASGAAHSVSFGADFKNFRDSIVLTGGVTDTTPMRYVGWSAGYGGNWRSERTSTGLNVSANFGLRGVINDPADFRFKRFHARANYLHLRGDLQHERPLFAGSTLFVRAAGQWTEEPLISNEQFAVGGADSVRGYLESEQLGDLGLAGSVEWRSPSLQRWLGGWAKRFIGLLFYDAGVVGIVDPLPDANGALVSRRELSSAGVGLRLDSHGWVSSLDWAYPSMDGDHTLRGDSRLHFQVRYGF